MCDEHADVMVGRILTVGRVRQLNAKDYFYQMLKDNPQLTAIYPGIENKLLHGAIDHHIHASPDFVHRSQDMFEVGIEAAKAGMRGVGFKDHFNLTANAAYLVQKHVNMLIQRGEVAWPYTGPGRDRGFLVIGGMGTCHGVNPEAVRQGIKYPNFKMVWCPTFTSAGYLRGAGKEWRNGVRLVGDDGRVLPNVREVMELCAQHKIAMGFGHTDFIELKPLAVLARELGVRAILDHPLLELNKLLIDEMKELADLGVYVGMYCQPMIPSIYQPVADPFETVETIQAVGAARCIIASDFGQVLHLDTVDGIRIMIRALLGFGISEPEIAIMIQTNPARLLYLDN